MRQACYRLAPVYTLHRYQDCAVALVYLARYLAGLQLGHCLTYLFLRVHHNRAVTPANDRDD